MTWVTLGVTGASQQVVGPEDTTDFRVNISFIIDIFYFSNSIASQIR